MSAARPTVDELMAATFQRPRDPRSDEYKAGARSVFSYRIDRNRIQCPYPPGTAAADAFHAGTHEGNRVWRETQEVQRNASLSRDPQYL